MVKLNRTTEYGLIALTCIKSKAEGELTSAREIAERYSLPFEILAKTLQKLKEQEIITSTYGTRGGYVLKRDLKTLSLLEFLKIMEGPVGVVPCVNTAKADLTPTTTKANGNCCDYETGCTIRPTMSFLNNKISDFLGRIFLDELTDANLMASPLFNTSPAFAAVSFGDEP